MFLNPPEENPLQRTILDQVKQIKSLSKGLSKIFHFSDGISEDNNIASGTDGSAYPHEFDHSSDEHAFRCYTDALAMTLELDSLRVTLK